VLSVGPWVPMGDVVGGGTDARTQTDRVSDIPAEGDVVIRSTRTRKCPEVSVCVFPPAIVSLRSESTEPSTLTYACHTARPAESVTRPATTAQPEFANSDVCRQRDVSTGGSVLPLHAESSTMSGRARVNERMDVW